MGLAALAVLLWSAPSFVAPSGSRGALKPTHGTARLPRSQLPQQDLHLADSLGAEQKERPDWWPAVALAGALCVAMLAPSGDFSGFPLRAPAAWAMRTSTSSGAKVNKDPVSLLQTALPLEELLGENNVQLVRRVQADVEQVKATTLTRLYNNAAGAAEDAASILVKERTKLLKPVSDVRKKAAEDVAEQLDLKLREVQKYITKGDRASAGTTLDENANKAVIKAAEEAQGLVGDLEEMMMPPGYASPIPDDVKKMKLPELQGRATVELKLQRAPDSTARKYTIDAEIFPTITLKVRCDGWSAPLSAGNFIDLVDKGFYQNMAIQRADGFITQFGDPGKKAGNGYRPTPDSKVRTIPLEVAIKGRKQALYGETEDEARLVGQQTRIPFQADGTFSMARAEFDNDSASSQVFLFILESDMTPAGKNFMDGRYGTFGYTIGGAEFLRQVQEGDVIVEAKVVQGLENLKR